MVNYKNGKIYKIMSNQTDKIYIGSTTKLYLSDRMGKHRDDFHRWIEGKCNYITSFELFEFNDVKIILIESYSCNSKDELKMREQYWIDKFKDICVNRNNAIGLNLEKRKLRGNKWRINHQKQHNDYNNNWAKIKKPCLYCDLYISNSFYNKHKKTKNHLINKKYFNDILNNLN